MDIVQFTDFHFGNEKSTHDYLEYSRGLILELNKRVSNPVFIISGDVTFRGEKEGYKQAKSFFKAMIDEKIVDISRILLCPGNHDIINNSFKDFDRFSFEIRQDNLCTFEEKNSREIVLDEVFFEIFNSSFHFDHKYGLIDDKCLQVKHEEKNKLKIAIMHHNILNMHKNDTSTIRNAYDLTNYLDLNKFNYVLHGHQHAKQDYYLGSSSIRVISGRSGNYNQTGYLNSVNIYRVDQHNFEEITLVPEQSGLKVKFMEIKPYER